MKTCIATVGLVLAFLGARGALAAVPGGRLILPASTLARTGHVPVVYRLSQGFTGHARLRIQWTDSLGRLVEDRTTRFDLVDERRVTFLLDMSHAIAMKNHLHVELSLNGTHIDGAPEVRHESADADFLARPPFTGWPDYVVIMWQPYPAGLLPALEQLGVNAGQYSGRLISPPDFLIDNNMRWYSESLATDFYATYHRWYGDRPKNWAFTQAKKRYQENPDSLAAFKRHPSFWDPHWRQLIHDRGVATARRNAPYRPYFYSLADESGIAELEAQWDFDFSDESLVPMRRWLRTQYGSLGALNREWGSHFQDWDAVMPPTTNQAMAMPGNNFAAWADFKTWMDISFADALKMGADAIREGDPRAYVAIGGSQMPGWGGYDYARLTRALTAIEPYDIGRSVDIVHSLNPSMPILTTAFGSGPWEKQRVWHELLHGNRGLIIWDADHDFVHKDGQPGQRGLQTAPYYHEIRDGEGALIINSRLINNRIAIHYSQPSLRTQWMLERRPDGPAWMTHGGKYARTHNHFMRLRESWCDLIEDEGLQFNFVSYDQIPRGELLKRGYHVLVLPESSALSPAEARAIRAFVAAGGIAIADGIPGTYDAHSRKLAQSSLADLFAPPQAHSLIKNPFRKSPVQPVQVRAFGQGKAILLHVDMAAYLQDRLKGTEGPIHRLMAKLLRDNGVHPQFVVGDGAGHPVVGVDMHVFANGGVRLLSLQSNPQMRASELGPPDFHSNQRFQQPITVHLQLPGPRYVYDTRTRTALGQKSELTLTIDPYEPTILAISNTPLAPMQVSVPARARRGSMITVAVHADPAQADVSVFHVDVRDPQGKRVLPYSGNLIARHGGGIKLIPLAANDVAGKWTITVHDLLSGKTIRRTLDVE